MAPVCRELDDPHRLGPQAQAADLREREPGGLARIVAWDGLAGQRLGREVDQRIMVADPSGLVPLDEIDRSQEIDVSDLERGLLPDLAGKRFDQRLAQLLPSAGQRPLAQPRSLAAADQEDLLASPDDAAYADHRPVGILAAHWDSLPASLRMIVASSASLGAATRKRRSIRRLRRRSSGVWPGATGRRAS